MSYWILHNLPAVSHDGEIVSLLIEDLFHVSALPRRWILHEVQWQCKGLLQIPSTYAGESTLRPEVDLHQIHL